MEYQPIAPCVEVLIPEAWLLQYARDCGIATDTSTNLAPLLQLEIDHFLREDEWVHNESTYGHHPRLLYQVPHQELLIDLESQKLDVGLPAAKMLTEVLNEKPLGDNPDWNSLLPTVPALNGVGHEYLLTSEGEMAAKSTLTRTMLGKNNASSLSLEDLPFELDHQYGRSRLQEIADSVASERLECSKKSLELIAETRRRGLLEKRCNAILEKMLPEMKVSSVN